MTEKKVLITYGSRFGSTEEISQEIAEVLKKKGIAVTFVNLRLKKNSFPQLQEYDGVITGSGIKMGKWTKETKAFLIKNKEKIRKIKTKGVFISSGWVSFPSKREQAKREYLEDVIKSLDIDIDLFEAFGGLFDLSQSSKVGFWNKKIIKSAIESELGPESLLKNAKNDFRDWDQIREYGAKFANLIQNS